ncbi:alpha/beta fold hydrolase [Novosphingobium sp.]|uniref:alpha/beta fold hydrolase n=1 Tax=Novosphingobium sp. TaxID=1874826 RepID=UPI003BA999D0
MIVELIDQLALDRPLVVGHSLGGAVALAMALLALAFAAPPSATDPVPVAAACALPEDTTREGLAPVPATPDTCAK